MPRYTVPTVFYQSSLDSATAVEIQYIKSLSWANKTNNNSSFELIIPMEGNPFTPELKGHVRLSPGNTVMHIEKIERQCDRKGNLWYKIGGRPTQASDEIVREAKNEDYYTVAG